MATVFMVTLAFFLSGTIFAPEQKGPEDGSTVNLKGQLVCLPHHNAGNGPQTLECAIGFKDTDGNYYGVRDETPNRAFLSGVEHGKDIQISGIFEAEASEKYQQIGIIVIKGLID